MGEQVKSLLPNVLVRTRTCLRYVLTRGLFLPQLCCAAVPVAVTWALLTLSFNIYPVLTHLITASNVHIPITTAAFPMLLQTPSPGGGLTDSRRCGADREGGPASPQQVDRRDRQKGPQFHIRSHFASMAFLLGWSVLFF